MLPKDIPNAPHYTYKDKGWKSMGDWLGTGVIATKFREYRSFENAKKFIHKLHLKNYTDWKKFKNSKNLPNDIPKEPSKVYKYKYKGLGDWLGTGFIATHERKYLNYNKAKKIVHKLKLQSQNEWFAYWKKTKPSNIPRSASQTYIKNKSWKNWGDFLGTQRIASKDKVFLNYYKAKKIITPKKFKNLHEFTNWLRDKKIQNIPNNASRIYKNKGWISWGEFLGTGYVRNKKYKTYKEAKIFLKKVKIKSYIHYTKLIKSNKLPIDFPLDPHRIYKNKGWKSFGEFAGTGVIATQKRKFRSFKKARNFIKNLKIKSQTEWRTYCKSGKKPNDMPFQLDSVYKNNGWKGWPDFLGKKNKN